MQSCTRFLLLLAASALACSDDRAAAICTPGTHGCALAARAEVPVQPVTGVVRAAAPLYQASRGAETVCPALPAGTSVEVERFAAGRYRITPRVPCRRGATAASGWVDAPAISIPAAAYGELEEVGEAPGLTLAHLHYAGDRIFCSPGGDCRIREPLYGQRRCLLRPGLADALTAAATRLQRAQPGLRLALLDCYRPFYVQQRMFEAVGDPVWVADPTVAGASAHNRGLAVDLTLADDRGPLDMGSGFDEFSERSHFDHPVSPLARQRRTLLRRLMREQGFRPYDAEWWHFSVRRPAGVLNYPL
jgi:D-alanyl-D-alanine dipeptidase